MTLTAVPRPHPPRGTPHHRHDSSPSPGPGARSGRPDAPPGTMARVRAVPATANRAVAA